ncbi:MAG: OmpA family protein [Gammaproteobacteria bacterium]|nr:OmpA family protein [Gammaproteobacteria bacterium]NNF61188.1 OmpA family protein [Gammaproteobacteria bacterium]NNM19883.1 OmpA family protein [Gammaproteobacteria bacterium]
MDDEFPQEEESAGAPAWVMTFADLMSLLMCFFVLMLAFSEMDAQRFKLLSGSMKDAFGVQADIEAKMMPKGTSIITKEFTPGRPQPTPMRSVRQFTINSNRNTLDILDSGEGEGPTQEELQEDVERIRKALEEEISSDQLNVDLEGQRIIISINEQASFDSGSDEVKGGFVPVLGKVRVLLAGLNGAVMVAGHTDDVPISTVRFRSNWELSAARAVSVAHELMRGGSVDPSRMVIAGHADTIPRASNDTEANRAANRRVEITVVRGGADSEQQVQATGEEEQPAGAES